MRVLAIVPLCLAVASAFMPPTPAVRTRVVTRSAILGAPKTGINPFLQTSHGGGIIMGGGDGDDNMGGGGGGNGGGNNEGNSGGDESSNPLIAFWKAYNHLLETQPILAKGLTSFVGFSLGDILAQKFIDKSEALDVKRLLKLASFGLLVHGPTGHYFYGALDGKMPGTDAVTVATKVAIDQILWNPIFGTMFFTYMGLAEGQDLEGIKTRLKNDLLTSVKGSWTVWPVAHAINFRFIPNSQRLLYINTVQVFYNCFLSLLANKGAKQTSEPVAVAKK